CSFSVSRLLKQLLRLVAFLFFINLQCLVYIRCFFFFQAEDGIRDGHVTGVQTCALPIYSPSPAEAPLIEAGEGESEGFELAEHRSEERRVGKECRARLSAVRSKKNCECKAEYFVFKRSEARKPAI